MRAATRQRQGKGIVSLGAAAAFPPAPTDLTGTATYYVDSVNGLNANNGTSTATPKQTLAGLPTLAAGNVIALKCGSTFREAMPWTGSGTSGNSIVWGQYGSGTKPEIAPVQDYSALTWAVFSGNIYSAPATSMSTNNTLLYVDKTTPLAKKTSTAAITAAGQYFADTTNSILYVRMPDNSSPSGHTIELNGLVSLVANTGTRSYVTVQDITIRGGYSNNLSGVLASSSTARGLIFQRCQIGPNNGIGIYIGVPTMIVQDCYVVNNWDAIEYPSSGGNSVGINIGTAFDLLSAVARRNRVTGSIYGIRINTSVSNIDIHHNVVYLNHTNGIDNGGATSNVRVYNNTIHHRPTATAGHGIDQQVGDGLQNKNNIVYCDFTGTATNVEMFCLSSGTAANTAEDYNLGYLTAGATSAWGKVGSTTYSTKAAYEAAAATTYSVSNAHTIQGDPLFNDIANADYRLKAGSPALNAGVVISGITDGYLGAAPDLGAFEMS